MTHWRTYKEFPGASPPRFPGWLPEWTELRATWWDRLRCRAADCLPTLFEASTGLELFCLRCGRRLR